MKYRNSGRIALYWAALGFFVFALLSKESAFILPALVIALEIWAMKDHRWRPFLGFVGLTALGLFYRWIALGGIGGYRGPNGSPVALRIEFRAFEGLFLRAPAQLIFGYNWHEPSVAAIIAIASITAAILLAMAAIADRSLLKRSILWLSLFWVVLALLPAHFLLMIGSGLTNSRVLYFAVPAIAILISILLAGVNHRRLRFCCKWTLVALFASGLVHNLNAWRYTGSVSHQLLSELRRLEPSPPKDAVFVFEDLPDTIRGVFFFHAGLGDAIRLAYHRSDLDAARAAGTSNESSAAPAGRPVIRLKWLGRVDELIERTQ